MKVEFIIKVLLCLGVLYFLLNCTNDEEKFTEHEGNNYFKLLIKSDNKNYHFVSLLDLKDEYKILFLKNALTEYREKDNLNSFFIFGAKQNNLIEYVENKSDDDIRKILPNIIKKNVSKIPVFIISEENLNIYTNKQFYIRRPSEGSEKLKTNDENIGDYMYWHPDRPVLFYSNKESIDYRIVGTLNNNNTFKINDIKDSNKNNITPTKITEKILRDGNLFFTHYTLSNNQGREFEWIWS